MSTTKFVAANVVRKNVYFFMRACWFFFFLEMSLRLLSLELSDMIFYKCGGKYSHTIVKSIIAKVPLIYFFSSELTLPNITSVDFTLSVFYSYSLLFLSDIHTFKCFYSL